MMDCQGILADGPDRGPAVRDQAAAGHDRTISSGAFPARTTFSVSLPGRHRLRLCRPPHVTIPELPPFRS